MLFFDVFHSVGALEGFGTTGVDDEFSSRNEMTRRKFIFVSRYPSAAGVMLHWDTRNMKQLRISGTEKDIN